MTTLDQRYTLENTYAHLAHCTSGESGQPLRGSYPPFLHHKIFIHQLIEFCIHVTFMSSPKGREGGDS